MKSTRKYIKLQMIKSTLINFAVNSFKSAGLWVLEWLNVLNLVLHDYKVSEGQWRSLPQGVAVLRPDSDVGGDTLLLQRQRQAGVQRRLDVTGGARRRHAHRPVEYIPAHYSWVTGHLQSHGKDTLFQALIPTDHLFRNTSLDSCLRTWSKTFKLLISNWKQVWNMVEAHKVSGKSLV